MDSILTSIKKLLGISEDDHYFDETIVMHINEAFMVLTQIGVGPSSGFVVTDDTTPWSDFIPDESAVRAEWIKTYIYLRVKLMFDPPSNQALLQSINNQISEYEWRLHVAAESEV